MRKITDFCGGWLFCKTDKVPCSLPSDWVAVTLPHTWNAEDGQDGGNDYWRGRAMYCKSFSRPETEKNGRVIIEFSGAAMSADVYLNGTHIIHHDGGYSIFRADMTDHLKDENLICVAVDNSENDRVYPQKADFTFYGGLCRAVKLISVPEIHFELCRDGTPGIKVTPTVEGKRAAVTVETWQNGGDVEITVADRTKTVKSIGGRASAEFIIENPRLWDGVNDPYLYTASASVGGDEISVRFGCRSFGFDSERGFILNGREYPLRGVSRHQDRKGIGNALTEKEHREDIELICEIGANTVRLAHYQQSQEFYDLCDEYGIIVWAEIPYITSHMSSGRENTLSQMRELITQCYNHPSIVCWGLSNEITASGAVTDDLMENHRLLNELCHRMDKTRPTTMAHVFMLETDSPLIDIPDIGSYNLYFGWYLGELEQNGSFFDEYHKKHPERIIDLSEYGADANPQFQTDHPERGDYTEAYQCIYHEYLLECIENRPYLWATHVWKMFDFAADGRNEGGNSGINQKGLVTFDRRHKKDAFYLYKAAWSKEPFVHLCQKGYIKRTGSVAKIKVYSNLPEVTLLLDGKEIEKKSGRRVFEFSLPISGTHFIEAKAGDVRDSMRIEKASEPEPSYIFRKEEIVNWFDRDSHDESCYSIRDTMGELSKNPKTDAIVERLMQQARASRGRRRGRCRKERQFRENDGGNDA